MTSNLAQHRPTTCLLACFFVPAKIVTPYTAISKNRLNLHVGDACTGIIDGNLYVRDLNLEHGVGVLGFVNLSIAVLLLCLILELINEIDDLFNADFPSACFKAANDDLAMALAVISTWSKLALQPGRVFLKRSKASTSLRTLILSAKAKSSAPFIFLYAADSLFLT